LLFHNLTKCCEIVITFLKGVRVCLILEPLTQHGRIWVFGFLIVLFGRRSTLHTRQVASWLPRSLFSFFKTKTWHCDRWSINFDVSFLSSKCGALVQETCTGVWLSAPKLCLHSALEHLSYPESHVLKIQGLVWGGGQRRDKDCCCCYWARQQCIETNKDMHWQEPIDHQWDVPINKLAVKILLI